MKILVIDNYDSFTYNLVHALKKIKGVHVDVKRNDVVGSIEPEGYDKIVLSPGPGVPKEAGNMLAIIKAYAIRKPLLGVCLGHQAIAENFGGILHNMRNVAHGIATLVNVVATSYLFQNMPNTFEVGRYHSWVVEKATLPMCLQITCEDVQGNIMALQHQTLDVQGVQFHPESILTPLGEKLLENWVKH